MSTLQLHLQGKIVSFSGDEQHNATSRNRIGQARIYANNIAYQANLPKHEIVQHSKDHKDTVYIFIAIALGMV